MRTSLGTFPHCISLRGQWNGISGEVPNEIGDSSSKTCHSVHSVAPSQKQNGMGEGSDMNGDSGEICMTPPPRNSGTGESSAMHGDHSVTSKNTPFCYLHPHGRADQRRFTQMHVNSSKMPSLHKWFRYSRAFSVYSPLVLYCQVFGGGGGICSVFVSVPVLLQRCGSGHSYSGKRFLESMCFVLHSE